ncbi:MAG TPA: hypothetical protein VHA07_09680, partial [Devosia sp.]|nr:hypothetical protein [Devosia sp.]
MDMKVAVYLVGLGIAAAAVSFGAAGLMAQQSTLMDFCPAASTPGTCSAAATMLVAEGNPGDDELITYIAAVAGSRVRSAGCADTAAGLSVLAGAIDSEAARALAQQVVAKLCGPGSGSAGMAEIGIFITPGSSATNMQQGAAPHGASCPESSGNPCSSSGSSGQTSGGTSGNTSGSTSGDNTSGGTSGGA